MIPHSIGTLALSVLAAALLVGIAALIARPKARAPLTDNSPLRARPLMTNNEREAYSRLRTAFPQLLVFPQVSLGSFIEPTHQRHWALRNRYVRLTADFLICDATSAPLVVVEIDDRSHARPKSRDPDSRKNAACEAANLHIIRWPATPLPTIDAIRSRLAPLIQAPGRP